MINAVARGFLLGRENESGVQRLNSHRSRLRLDRRGVFDRLEFKTCFPLLRGMPSREGRCETPKPLDVAGFGSPKGK